MLDNYLYRVEDKGRFIAGYNLCTIDDAVAPVFLFSTLRFIRVLGGEADWKIGNNEYKLKTGDIIAVNNIEKRQFYKTSDESFVCDVFAFSPSLLSEVPSFFSLFYASPMAEVRKMQRVSPYFEQTQMLLDLLKEKISQDNCNSDVKVIMISSLFVLVTSNMLDLIGHSSSPEFKLQESVSQRSVSVLLSALKILGDDIAGIDGVSDLASKLSVSRGYLTQIFKKYLGLPAVDYINSCRLDRTIFLLASKEINVIDAAMESGFKSSSGFYKAFHSVYGVSPKKVLSTIYR